ncbi:hypothetical protein BDR22DRAFT_887605 [Usnea florida]
MSSVPNASSVEIPAGIPPPGVIPNFINPPTLVPTIIAFSVVMITWTLSFVLIRLYANFHAPRGLGIDDYSCIIATVLAFGYTALQILSDRYARHGYDLPLAWLDDRYIKVSYSVSVTAGPALFFAKSTILLLYLRVFSVSRPMRYGIWSGLAFALFIYWSGVLFGTLWCAPRGGEKDLKDITQKCEKDILFGLIQGVLGVVLDLYIFLLPIPTILGLQMSLRRRLSILSVFGTAILGIAAAAVGLVYRVKLHASHGDLFWATACVYICNACESYVAIIVGSMPAFASFFKGQMPGAILLASMNSLALRCRNAASGSGVRFARRTSTELPASQDLIIPNKYVRDKGYLELYDTRRLGEDGLGPSRTNIGGEQTYPNDLEEGVVRKTVTVHQSTQAPSATQLSEQSTFTTWG